MVISAPDWLPPPGVNFESQGLAAKYPAPFGAGYFGTPDWIRTSGLPLACGNPFYFIL